MATRIEVSSIPAELRRTECDENEGSSPLTLMAIIAIVTVGLLYALYFLVY